jgi:hypothetical protein
MSTARCVSTAFTCIVSFLWNISNFLRPHFIIIIIIIIIYLFIYLINYTASGFLPGGSGTTVRHNTRMAHQIKINTAHKTTHTTKETLAHSEYNENTLTTTII